MPQQTLVDLSIEQQQAALHALTAQIGDLIARHGLHQAGPRSPVAALARAHLYTALSCFDGAHKGLALQFLHEARLIGGSPDEIGHALPPVLPLNYANLRGLVLPYGNLGWSTIVAADLSRADLRGVSFTCANLSGVDLIEADLRGTKFTRANLMLADLTGANLDGAYLAGAKILPAQLAQAKVTERTVLPDANPE